MNDSKFETIACWKCGARMSVTADQMGDSVECPECQAQTTVPPEAFGFPPAAKTVESGAASPPQFSQDGEPSGIGGWLVLPAIGLILGIVLGVVGLVAALIFMSEVPSYEEIPYTVALVFDLGVFVFLIYTAVRFFGKRRNAPGTYIALCIAAVVASGLVALIGVTDGIEEMAILYGIQMLINILASVIWIPYFSVSRRVRNTFVRL